MFGQYSSASTRGARYTVGEMRDTVARDVGGPIESSRKAGHNRLAFTLANGARGFVFHATCIAMLSPEGDRLTLSDGGWPTVTTRGAMSDALKAFGFGYVGVWGHKGQNTLTFKGVSHVFDRTITLDTATGNRLDAGAVLPLIRADVMDGDRSAAVTFDAKAKRLESSDGISIPADARRALMALYRIDRFAKATHRLGYRERQEARAEVLGYEVHRPSNSKLIGLGCHTFKLADVRAAMRRIAGEHPEAAKRARALFLAEMRKAVTVAAAAA